MAQITLNARHFKHNLNLITNHINRVSHGQSQVALVLKDNAYGHGLLEMARLARQNGIKSVFVKNHAEAKIIAPFFESITILYGTPQGTLTPNMAIAINNKEIIDSLHSNDKVELKVNARMNRNGIAIDEIKEYIEIIESKGLHLFGVFAHNGYGDDGGEDFTQSRETFTHIKEQIKNICINKGLQIPRFHFLSTSGALRAEAIDDELVRIGIGAYGYLESNLPIAKDLRPVAALFADKINTKTLYKGDKIGYGGKSVLQKDATISTYDIGYGDGFPRIDDGLHIHCASGELILPRTSMDCFSCESEKNQICVFDDVREIARAFNTITYEILTHLSPTIPRVIIDTDNNLI